jgi:hypothetical protein
VVEASSNRQKEPVTTTAAFSSLKTHQLVACYWDATDFFCCPQLALHNVARCNLGLMVGQVAKIAN